MNDRVNEHSSYTRTGPENLVNEARMEQRFLEVSDASKLVEVLLKDLVDGSTHAEPSDGPNTMTQLRSNLYLIRTLLDDVTHHRVNVTDAYKSPIFQWLLAYGSICEQGTCMVCLKLTWLLVLPCNGDHRVCKACTHAWFLSAMQSAISVFPPRCCGIPVPFKLLKPFVEEHFINEVNHKIEERKARKPILCRNCSRFITCATKLAETQRKVDCPICTSKTCVNCRQLAHDGACPEDAGLGLLHKLSKQSGWMKCPKCPHVLERIAGCNHMTCICGTEYCYACGSILDERRQPTCRCLLFLNEPLPAENRELRAELERRYLAMMEGRGPREAPLVQNGQPADPEADFAAEFAQLRRHTEDAALRTEVEAAPEPAPAAAGAIPRVLLPSVQDVVAAGWAQVLGGATQPQRSVRGPSLREPRPQSVELEEAPPLPPSPPRETDGKSDTTDPNSVGYLQQDEVDL